jgi:hypothetical protein
VATQGFPLNAVLDACRQVQFGMTDLIRRTQGDVFGALGLDPIESPYRVIFSGPFWRLRDYGEHDATQSLLIVAAPIKRPDAALSATDNYAHARVERWALDEVPLPGKLVHQIVEWLYREDRFCRGDLTISDALVGPLTLSVPTLAVVNTADGVAPLGSVKPFLDAMPMRDARIVEYPGEVGVCLQHLGILIGRKAHAQAWPEIIFWIESHR